MRAMRVIVTFVSLLPAGNGSGNPALKPEFNSIPDTPLARLGSDRFRAAGHVAALAFSPDGSRLASLAENGMSVWDTSNGRETRFVDWHYAHPRILTWPAKGQPLAVLAPANDGTYLWAFADEKAIVPRTALGETSDDNDAENPRERLSHVAISSDGARVAAANASPKGAGPIRIWDATAGKRLHELKPFRSIDVGKAGWCDFGLSPNGKTLLVFSSDPKAELVRLTLFDLESGKERKRLNVPPPAVSELSGDAFALSSDGGLIAIGRTDTTTVIVDLAGTQKPIVLGKPGPEERDRVVAISPDGKWVATNHYGSVIVWDVTRGQQARALKQVSGLVTAITFSRDGKRLACASRSGLIQVWATETWDRVAPPKSHTDSVAGVTISPDGKTAVTASADSTLRIWEVHSGIEIRSVKPDDSPTSVHFAPDGKSVFVSAHDFGRAVGKFGTKVFRVELNGKSEPVAGELGKGFEEPLPTSKIVGFAADGRTLLTQRARTISVWDWPAGTKRRSIEVTLPGTWAGELNCRSSSLSADGRLLAVSFDHEERKDFGNVRGPGGTCVVDAMTGERLWSLSGPAIWYAFVAFTPDGKKLLVGGAGDSKGDELNEERISLRMFDAATGKPVRDFRLPDGVKDRREVKALVVSTDGRTVMVGEKDHSITVYELATGQIRQQFMGHRSELKDLVVTPNGRLLSVAWNDPFALVWATNPATAAQRELLTEVTLETEWRKLTQGDSKSAFRVMARMAGDPKSTVEYLRKQMKPAKPIDAKVLGKALEDLEAESVDDRDKASQALNDLGRDALQAARTRSEETKSEDAKGRLARFIQRQDKEELNTEELRAVRTVELLESIGTEEARKVLQELAKGSPAARLTSESAAALRRLQPKRH